jgi:hypothetical protein
LIGPQSKRVQGKGAVDSGKAGAKFKNKTRGKREDTYGDEKTTRGSTKYDKQDQQGKEAFNECNPARPSNKYQWQEAQEDPKQKQDRAQGRALTG